MQVAQRVDGVEHIMSLELAIQGREPSCADVA